MKQVLTQLRIKASKMIALAVFAGAMASCDSVLDFNDGDCSDEYRVRFKYDYNRLSADAFSQEVKTVTLYAFDKDGNFIYQKTEEGDILKNEDYSMKLDIDPGEYHFIVWAGLKLNDPSFAIPLLTPGVSTIDQLTVKTIRKTATRANGENENLVNKELTSLWHGEKTCRFVGGGAKRESTTIDLVKNTNTLRIMLGQTVDSDFGIDVDKFDFSIYDDNGWMNYNNLLLKDDLLTYKPYSTRTGSTSSRAIGDTRGETVIDVAIAELSVARLMVGQKPILRITNNVTHEVAIEIDLMKYLQLLRMEKYSQWSEQEYFDRMDDYELTFFLGKDLTWLKTVIVINGWTIRLNEGDL